MFSSDMQTYTVTVTHACMHHPICNNACIILCSMSRHLTVSQFDFIVFRDHCHWRRTSTKHLCIKVTWSWWVLLPSLQLCIVICIIRTCKELSIIIVIITVSTLHAEVLLTKTSSFYLSFYDWYKWYGNIWKPSVIHSESDTVYKS